MSPEQLMAMVSDAMPELYDVYEAMKSTKVPSHVLVAVMGELQVVQNKGWGSVTIDVQRHQLTKVEGRSQQLFAVTQYERKEKQNRYEPAV